MANRQSTFLLKRSNVAGKIPTSGDLLLGEMALNTADVILYTSGTTANSILPIGWDRVARTGDTMTGQLNVPTISATTYLNLPIDIYVTGVTYNNANQFTFTNNTGGTFNTLFNTVTGLTVNGDLTVTGTTSAEILTATTVTGLTTNVNELRFNTAYTGGTTIEGVMYWDEPNGTVSLGLHNNEVSLQIGQETHYYIKNQSGATIENGRVVRAAGTLGASGRILGEYMIADGSIEGKYTLGVATEDILDGNDGYVTEFGLVRGINTTGSLYGETWNDGDILYVSPTIAGGLTNVRPQSPNLNIEMAIVIYANASGSIFVRPHRYPRLSDLQNVTATGATDGDLLLFDGVSWLNTKTLGGSYTITGDTSIGGGLTASTISTTTINSNIGNIIAVDSDSIVTNTLIATSITGDTISATTYQGNVITSGTSVGSGTDIFKQKNGNNLEFRSISAGTNITITTGDTLTISSTGGGSSRTTGSTTTTNATPTTIATIATTTNSTQLIEVYIKAYQTSATNYGVWKRTLGITNVSGTPTIQSTNSDVTKTSSGLKANSITFSVSGSNILVQVTGIAATTINWNSAYEIIL